MHDDKANSLPSEDAAQLLRDVRTHLTIAMLAAQRVHRSHPHATSVAHLFTHLHAAHQQLLRDIERIEAILQHLHAPPP